MERGRQPEQGATSWSREREQGAGVRNIEQVDEGRRSMELELGVYHVHG